jgi:hypothetical protein
MWDRLAGNSPNATKSTNVPSTTTTHPPPVSHNTYSKKHTLSALSTTSCKYCNTTKKSPHLNTIEKFHIYTEYLNDSHLNDEQTFFPNKIFDALLKT